MPYEKSPIPELRVGKDKIMHASLETGANRILASDLMPGRAYQPGNDFQLFLDCENQEEIEKLFSALSENGKVEMPLQDVFWGARFGALTDQFGILWRLNCSK